MATTDKALEGERASGYGKQPAPNLQVRAEPPRSKGSFEQTVAGAEPSQQQGERPSWSLLDLTAPLRSQVFLNIFGDLLYYSGANEVTPQVDIVRGVCRELCDQVNEECLTFNYDDTCSAVRAAEIHDEDEVKVLSRAVARHPRLRYFECMLHSKGRFRAMLQHLQLPPDTVCSFVLEFKVRADEVRMLLQCFRVRRLNIIPEVALSDSGSRAGSWSPLPSPQRLRTVCLRSCTDDIVRVFSGDCLQLRDLQIVDSLITNDPCIKSEKLTSLSLTGIVRMPDELFSQVLSGCQNLRSLYISKCPISNIAVSLPHLELLSVTHCRQLTDQCITELLRPSNTPSLRFVDLTENRGLLSPVIAHSGLEIAWLMHCAQLTDQAVTYLFQHCPSLTAVNLVQSSIESAFICSPALRTLELATSQKLTDAAVTELLKHCPSLTFLDMGHCCQLLEPIIAHASLESILLSFCVNLREVAISNMFRDCPSLRYVELAVCMFDMEKFQREASPKCQVVVNFDF